MTKGLRRTSKTTLLLSLDCPSCEQKPFSVSVKTGSSITGDLFRSLPDGFSCMVTKGHSARILVQPLSVSRKSLLDRWCVGTPTEPDFRTRTERLRDWFYPTFGALR